MCICRGRCILTSPSSNIQQILKWYAFIMDGKMNGNGQHYISIVDLI